MLEESFRTLQPRAVAAAWSTDEGCTWQVVLVVAVCVVTVTNALRSASTGRSIHFTGEVTLGADA